MARRGDIEIPIAVDTGGTEKAIQNGLIEPIEDAEKALKALGDTDAGRDLDKEMDRAQDATEDLRDELDDARDDLKKLGYAARDAGDDGKRGLGRIRDGAQEVSQEMGQNLGEAVSSVRGDLSDLGQVGQDTLGGLAASLAGTGPAGIVGAVALAAGAVGWGLIAAEQEAAKERQEKVNEAASQWADAYAESADRIVSASHVVAEVQAIATDPERYQEAKENAKNWGIDVSTAMRAMAGDSTALEQATSSLTEKEKEWQETLKETSTGSGSSYDKSTLTDQQRALGDEVRKGTESLDMQNEAMRLGKEQADNSAKALYDYALQVGTATEKTDDLGNKIYTLPDGKEIVVDTDTRKAYEDLDAVEKRRLADKEVTVRARLDTSAWDNWRPQVKTGRIQGTLMQRQVLGP